jgi:hypothetical protein
MNKIFLNKYPEINVYKKKSIKSEIITQIVYGEGFEILKKFNKWLKIKIKEDCYIGFIKKNKFTLYAKPTHKIFVLSANLFKNPNLKSKIGTISFGAKIKADFKKSKFMRFQNKWIETKNLKPISFKYKDIFHNVKIFKNTKYKWGGKTFNGIDCSGLIQVFFNFNNKYCPRDTVDQIKYFKKNIEISDIKKNDIIFWKGHVAIVLSKTRLIHAYGPKKKTIIMDIKKTIELIKQTAGLNVLGIKRI